ncbi:hypothetical protein QFC24_006462 [Naganishia onofrii]|uniref:Uncharacterized protein n=1 Tax=Naganishia onofrii TaxID=1851511 RepID=A0ACC2X034_9TREE|nr:hypothetical protein QFC24_006462 [Naganishia onofrii]
MTDARERRTDEGIVNKIVLTANQAKMWLMPDVSPMSVEQRKRSRELAVQLGLKSYDYVAGKQSAIETGRKLNQAAFAQFPLSRDTRSRGKSDSLWFKPTFDETTGKTLRVNMARSADFSKNEYHGLQTFRKRALQSLQPWTSVPQTSTPAFKAADFFPSFVRTDSYEEFGHGIAACMSFAKLWRSPLAYFGGAVPPRQDPNSEEVEKAHFFGAKELQPDDIWYDLWSIGDRKNHARTAHATTIAFEKVIAAAARAQPPSSNDPPPNPVENFADLGGIAVTGSDVDSCLWPEVYIGAWRAYKILEKERRLPMLFYIVFHEKHLATYNLDQEER